MSDDEKEPDVSRSIKKAQVARQGRRLVSYSVSSERTLMMNYVRLISARNVDCNGVREYWFIKYLLSR